MKPTDIEQAEKYLLAFNRILFVVSKNIHGGMSPEVAMEEIREIVLKIEIKDK